jgi:sensor histidine kinase YesM
MEAVMKNSVSLEDELERLKLYLNFEKLRFGNKLKYKIIIPDEINIDELILPPMILQPFVENAIWHGLMPLPNGGEIIITVNLLDENNFQVLIKDTGIGIDTSKGRKHGQELKHNSKGIQLSIERLQLWTKSKDKKLDLKIEQLQQNNLLNGGTLVSLILPRKID